MEKVDRPPLHFADLMLLLDHGDLEPVVYDMVSKAKKSFVDARHPYMISQMKSSTYKNGWYKTYVRADGKRKEVVRKTEEELYSVLYDFYKALEHPVATLESQFASLQEKKRNQLGRSNNTVKEDTRYFNKVSMALRKKPLCSITEEDIRKWITTDYILSMPKKTALNKMLQLLRQIFELGIDEKNCQSNPAIRIKSSDYLKFCDNTKKPDENREFSKEELDALSSDLCTRLNNPRAVMALLAKETGMRVGELCALQAEDVTEDYIHVHRQQIRERDGGKQWFHDVEYTKDERENPRGGRYVPVTKECGEILNYISNLPGESKYLIHDKNGNPVMKDSYEQFLNRRCTSLGLNAKHNHAFRLSFNSRLIDLGLSPAERALILGHSVETNERHYSVTDKRKLASIREVLRA